jgi:PAS domain S-box-containing protein
VISPRGFGEGRDELSSSQFHQRDARRSGGFQQELKRSEENFRSLFDNMMTGFALHRIILDERDRPVDFVFLEVNSVFERLTGLTREKTIGRRATEVMPGLKNDSIDWMDLYGKVALTGETVRMERHSAYLGGWYSLAAYSPRKGYFAVLFDDITARKRVEEQLRESERKFRAIFDQTFQFIGLMTPDGALIEATGPPSPSRGSGNPMCSGSHFGNAVVDALSGDAGRLRAAVAEASQGRLVRFEATHVAADGSTHFIDFSLKPVEDESGRVVLLIPEGRDITDRKGPRNGSSTSPASCAPCGASTSLSRGRRPATGCWRGPARIS